MAGAWGDSFGYCVTIGTILAEDYLIEINDNEFEVLLDDTEFIIEIATPQS
jgi:hypothetical protein